MNDNYEIIDDKLVITKTTTQVIGSLEELQAQKVEYEEMVAGLQTRIDDLNIKIAMFN